MFTYCDCLSKWCGFILVHPPWFMFPSLCTFSLSNFSRNISHLGAANKLGVHEAVFFTNPKETLHKGWWTMSWETCQTLKRRSLAISEWVRQTHLVFSCHVCHVMLLLLTSYYTLPEVILLYYIYSNRYRSISTDVRILIGYIGHWNLVAVCLFVGHVAHRSK